MSNDRNSDDKKIQRDKEHRKQQKLGKLGTNVPVCVVCGESDHRCFDDHHIAGKAYDDIIARLCKNDHAKLSDDQRDHPKPLGKPPLTLERIGRMLLGLCDLLRDIADKFWEFGLFLIELARQQTGKGDTQ